MIHLSNVLGADMWVCVPHAADDSYVTSLATLIRDTLRPDLRVVTTRLAVILNASALTLNNELSIA